MCTGHDYTYVPDTCRIISLGILYSVQCATLLCLRCRPESNLSSTCGHKQTTKPASHSSQGDSDKDSLYYSSNSLSQSLEEGTPNHDNGSTDTRPNTDSKRSKKCNNSEDKSLNSEQITSEEQGLTRANLPLSEDASIKSAPSKQKLRASAKPASAMSEDCLLGNNLGDECQNQHNDCKRGHDAVNLAELQPSSSVQNQATMDTYIWRPAEDITHAPLQETKYDQESSEDTPINKKVHDTSEYMLLGKDQYGQGNITHVRKVCHNVLYAFI